MDAAAARGFLDRSLGFSYELEQAMKEEIAAGTTDLWPLTLKMKERFGPYPVHQRAGRVPRCVAAV
jgi:hypothetical protein